MSLETFINNVAKRAALYKRAEEENHEADFSGKGDDAESEDPRGNKVEKADKWTSRGEPVKTLPPKGIPDVGLGQERMINGDTDPMDSSESPHRGEEAALEAQLKADARRARKEKLMNGLAATGNWMKGFNGADIGAGIGTAWLVDALAGRHINSKLLRLLLGAGSGVGGMGASRAVRYGYGKALQGYDNYKKNRKVGDTPKQMQKNDEAHATDKELKEREDLVAQGKL